MQLLEQGYEKPKMDTRKRLRWPIRSESPGGNPPAPSHRRKDLEQARQGVRHLAALVADRFRGCSTKLRSIGLFSDGILTCRARHERWSQHVLADVLETWGCSPRLCSPFLESTPSPSSAAVLPCPKPGAALDPCSRRSAGECVESGLLLRRQELNDLIKITRHIRHKE